MTSRKSNPTAKPVDREFVFTRVFDVPRGSSLPGRARWQDDTHVAGARR